MIDESRLSEPSDPQVAAAVREYLERLDRGELVDREEFLARHALIADQLRSFIAAEDDVRKLAAAATPLDRAHESTKSFVGHGLETVMPQSVGKRITEIGGTGLAGQFGRYRIIRALGKGAMGTVYLAEDTQLERRIALKTPHFTEDPTGEQMERFFREARAAGNLRHPNICPIHDFGQIDGKHYISMAYIEGRTLSAFIQPDKPQTERQILIVVRKLALALQEAHDHGIVHRDLKPANIMVDKKGEPIIMDFGLAQHARRNDDIRLTQTGNILGTPAFMSPEQVEGEPDKIGSSTDQYSLGVILYELLTGQLPFRGSVVAVMGQILTAEPPRPSQLRSEMDQRVEALCLKMMAKNPSQRFESLKAVADELASILRSPASKATSEEQPVSSAPTSPAGDRMRADAGASQVLKSLKRKAVTESGLASLEELARKCLARHDYEQVIQIIERIPDAKRNAGLVALLEKSRDKTDEIAFLICEIDEADRLSDARTALKKAEDLLKTKPGHHRALKVREKYSGYGEAGAARIAVLDQFRRPLNDGGWIPWSVLAFGFAVFAVMTAAVTIYLRSGNTVVKIEINDPSVEVTVKGSTAAIKSPGQEVSVEPGENELTVTYGELTFTTKSFTLKKGEKKTIAISIVDSKVIAKLGDEILEERPLKPLPSIPAGGNATTTVVKTIPPASLIAPCDENAAKNAQKQWATHLQIPVEMTNSIGMNLALVPPGKFKMGSSDADAEASPDQRPLHQVSITRPFFLGTAEVTRGQFAAFIRAMDYKTEAERDGRGGVAFDGRDWRWDTKYSWRNPGFDQDDSHPVVNVSWNDAGAFCDWLSRKEKKTYRLPTEAEWEYACRAGTETQFYSGGANSDLPMIANFGHTNGPTSPVGSFRANSFSLFDMSGNVVEWCQDWYGVDYYSTSPAQDPPGPSNGGGRVLRGGSYFNGPESCRSATRRADPPDYRISDIGFRVSLSIEGAPNASAATVKPNAPQLLVSPFDKAAAKDAQKNLGNASRRDSRALQ
jgi:formylglycine-generating enzyme required for sulfatase activity/serine/threonine protein kinase